MTVRSRLLLTLAGMTVLLTLPGLYAARQLAQVSGIAEEIRGRHAMATRALGRLQTTNAELERFQRSFLATPTPDLRAGVRESLDSARAALARLDEAYYADETAELGAILTEYEAAATQIEELVDAGLVEAATVAFEERVPPLRLRARVEFDRLAAEIDARSRDRVVAAREISMAATTTTLAAAATVLVLALLLGLWTTGALTTPLRRLRDAMSAVAAGRFVAPRELPYRRADEIGDLAMSFQRMTQQLAELDRLKAEFVSVASHELKTPLNVIGGYVELMEEGIYGDVPAQQREVLSTLREQVHTLTWLVDQLLDISRIEAGGLRIEPREVPLDELLERVGRSFHPLARQKEIEFEIVKDPALPATMQADGDRIRNEVIGNLLSNAFKFTPAGGRIRLKAWLEGRRVLLEVSDTGAGIPPEQLPHIFEKYYQVGDRARAIGTGLGLAIAREVVEAHGGRILAESEPGQGTIFRVVLPLNHQDPEPVPL